MSSQVFQKKDVQMMGKSRHMFFEVLEPRILLSGDGLLYAVAPDPLQDMLLDNTPLVPKQASSLRLPRSGADDFTGT